MAAEQAAVAASHRADTQAQLKEKTEDDAGRARAEIVQLRTELDDVRRRTGESAGGLDVDQLLERFTAAVRGVT